MNDPKYGRITTTNKEIPEDEPVFLLRGQDLFAPTAVDLYAAMREQNNEPEVAAEIHAFAERMRQWQPQKFPD